MGMGMLDVAMHLYHSVSLDAMVDGGEERLLRFYHRRLTERIGPGKALRYPFHTAMRHYRICLVDYARVVLSYFFKGASPASFAAKAEKENCGLVYRHLGCAMRFVEEVEKAVSFLEAEEGKGGGLTLDETRGGQGRRRGRGARAGGGVVMVMVRAAGGAAAAAAAAVMPALPKPKRRFPRHCTPQGQLFIWFLPRSSPR
jgi:hypothetical protein